MRGYLDQMFLLLFSKIPSSFDSLFQVPQFHPFTLVFNPWGYLQVFLLPFLQLQELIISFPQCFSSKHLRLSLFEILAHHIHSGRQTSMIQWQRQHLYLLTCNLLLKKLFYSFQTPILRPHPHILNKLLQICRPTHSGMEVLLHHHRFLLFLDSLREFQFY
jgi:hypothetical protein